MKATTAAIVLALSVLLAGCASMPEAPPAETPEPAAPLATPPPPPVVDEMPAGEVAERVAPPFNGLHTLEIVFAHIRKQEGLVLHTYTGPSGKLLIGYGHGGPGAVAGRVIDKAEAERLLRQDVQRVEEAVKSWVTVPINGHELSAMVDLAYNVGTGNFRESTVLRKLNQNDRLGAADGFLLWNKVNGVVNQQLVKRRTSTRALFLGEDEAGA